MSPRDWRLRIDDILEAIERIAQYTAGMTRETFSVDDKTLDAVIRNIEVIGEAARHVPDVPWAEMRAMRNILIHEYFLISVPILWHTVTQNLTPLFPQLRSILSDHRD